MDNRTYKILQKFSTQKVDLSLISDYEKLVNVDIRLEKSFASSGSKIETEAKSLLRDLNDYLQNNEEKKKIARKLKQLEKDLGVQIRETNIITDSDGSAVSQVRTMRSTITKFISDLKTI